MTFLLVFVITVVAVYALRTPLKRWPVVFYALAIVLDVLFVMGSFVRLPGPLNDVLFLLVHKCTLATALFIVVLYIGVFSRDGLAVALVIALVLFVLLLVLGVTSFNVVKKRMPKETWKRIQWWAYPFFGLVYVHLMLMLLPAALRGGEAALMSVVVYTVLFGAYAVLRIARALKDRRAARNKLSADCR